MPTGVFILIYISQMLTQMNIASAFTLTLMTTNSNYKNCNTDSIITNETFILSSLSIILDTFWSKFYFECKTDLF